jgi:heptosyltransferase-1
VKILVIKPSSLGDIVHGLRIVHQVHEILPTVRIDWVVKKGLEDILTASGFVEKVYLFERGGGFLNYLRLIKAIRRENYDFALDLQGLLRSACLLKFTHSKQKLGVADGRECSTFLYKSIGEKSRKAQIHAIDRLVPFLKELSIKKFDPLLSMDFPETKISKTFTERLEEKKIILLFPESRRSEKVWPFFKELSQSLSKENSFNIVVAGNKQDQQFPHAIDLRGQIKLGELPDLIKRADLVISNDSAPLHIASALRKPLLALFGPTSSAMYGPYPLNSTRTTVLSASDGKIDSITINEVELQIKKLIS